PAFVHGAAPHVVRRRARRPALRSERQRAIPLLLAALSTNFSAPLADADVPDRYCRIEVVEKGTGWPVPLAELRTTHHVRFVADNAGVIAFDLPELFGRETWFEVHGHGYEVPKDGF